ncbi:MAG: membrane protein insertase YidC [Acidobacteria bacterium]|nr:membrane protein insertase YidC [Acidobacteriota bacterium]
MEKRAIIAIGLSIVVFVLFSHFQRERMAERGGAPGVESVRPRTEAPAPAETPALAGGASGIAEAAAAEAATQAALPAGAEDTRAEAQKITVMGNLYTAVIDNRGGVLSSWELNKYRSGQQKVFEMVAPARGGETGPRPGALLFGDEALTALAGDALYEVTVEGGQLGGGVLAPPATVRLLLRRGDLVVEKRYSFDRENFLVDLAIECTKGGVPLAGHYFLGKDIGPEQEHISSRMAKLEAIYYSDGKARREGPPKSESEIKKIEGDIRWVGLDMQYFSMIAIPDGPLGHFNIRKHAVKTAALDGDTVDRDLLELTLPMTGSARYQLYVGPKDQDHLKAVRSGDITGVVNYGMFSFLVYPLLAALEWIHQFVHNYGWAIVILTLLLSLLLFPFRLKQMVSMKRMQAVQPKVKAIQEKYRRYKKTDPKRAEMNQEIMALYKEHNVNPLGGCLPLLLQFPLLFAFYALLAYSIELRQAPFIWWIHDLSLKDPYYVLPVVMGITSFISQKLTPMTPGADPMQAKMMMIMPVIFTVMFLNFSSGLNLYFLCSNIFQVLFQKIAERWMGDGTAAKPAKARA